jgi:putative protease
MWNTKGEPIEVAPGSGHFVWIELKPEGDKVFIARYI